MVLMEGDVWRYAAGGALITGDPDEATWLPTLTEAEAYKARRAVIARDVALEVRLRREQGAEQSTLARIDNPYWEALLDKVEQGVPE